MGYGPCLGLARKVLHMCFEAHGFFGNHGSLGAHGIFVLSVIWPFSCPERDLQLTAKLLSIGNPPLHFYYASLKESSFFEGIQPRKPFNLLKNPNKLSNTH